MRLEPVLYGSALAWIGMVLTDRAYRGRGLARTLMIDPLPGIPRKAGPVHPPGRNRYGKASLRVPGIS